VGMGKPHVAMHHLHHHALLLVWSNCWRHKII
jgi:hypothetical protein